MKLIELICVGWGVLFQVYPDYHPQYHKLQEFLGVYQDIAFEGGWPSLAEIGDTLKAGMTDPMIPLLRTRLSSEKYLPPGTAAQPMLFDREIEKALKQFQRNNGLPDSGFLDDATISMLNVPVEKRIEQIGMNMERWKVFPSNPGDHYLLVNVANFRLDEVKDCDTILNMKVVVGQTNRETPEFQAKMTHIIFNPSWQIPSGILHSDILPKVRMDSTYLRRNNIQIFKTEKDNYRKLVSSDSIDWNSLSVNNTDYTFIESPGPANPLGVVKFIFPNRHEVYMHDTPLKELFKEAEPAFSSGCIRLSNAVELACSILEGHSGWSRRNVEETIQSGESVTVNLIEPLDVYIAYFTSWVKDDGHLQFRKDIYKKDIPPNILEN